MDLKIWSASLQLLVIVAVQCHRLPGHHRAHRHEDSPRIVWEWSEGVECRKCPAEWGVVHLCNSTHSTLCQPCPSHTWTPERPHLEKCEPCSECGDGLYIDTLCRPTHDTKCGWCESEPGSFNIDFFRKCIHLREPHLTGSDEERKEKAMKAYFEETKANEEAARLRPADGNQHHQNWIAEGESTMQESIRFKPSFHDYESAGVTAEKRKIFILLAIAGSLLLVLSIFGFCLAKNYLCGERIRAREQRLYVQLSSQDHQIIDDCAKKLAKSQPGIGGEDEEYWEDDPMKITENPLESLYIHKTKRTLF